VTLLVKSIHFDINVVRCYLQLTTNFIKFLHLFFAFVLSCFYMDKSHLFAGGW